MKKLKIFYFHGLIGSDTNWLHLIKCYKDKNIQHINLMLDYLKPLNKQINKIENNYCINKKMSKNICIANSLGCLIALKMADKFDYLILIAPPYKFFKGSAILSPDRIVQLKKELFFNPNSIPEDELNKSIKYWLNIYKKRVNIKKLKKLKQELLEFDFIKAYSKYQNKIHFILGNDDKLVPVNEFKIMHGEYCKNANLSIIKNCAHAIQIEKPLELYSIINSDIKKRFYNG